MYPEYSIQDPSSVLECSSLVTRSYLKQYIPLSVYLDYWKMHKYKIIKCTGLNDIEPNKHIDIPTDIWQYFTLLQKYQMKKGITLIYNLLASPPTE